MRGPDGTESWGKTTYLEVTPPSRLVYSDAFTDTEGNIAEGMPVMLIRPSLPRAAARRR